MSISTCIEYTDDISAGDLIILDEHMTTNSTFADVRRVLGVTSNFDDSAVIISMILADNPNNAPVELTSFDEGDFVHLVA